MKKIKILTSMFAFVLVIIGAVCLTGCVKGEESETSKSETSKTAININIDTSNVKVVYFEGENLSTAGLIVNKVFSDGSEQQTQDYIINDDEFTSNIAGQYRIEVKVGNFSKIYSVNVYEKDYRSLFSIAKANVDKINNWMLYGNNVDRIVEMANNEGYYQHYYYHTKEWVTKDGEYIVRGSEYNNNVQESSFIAAYARTDRHGYYEDIHSLEDLIQVTYNEAFLLEGDSQVITREDYTRSDDGNIIYLQLSYTYDIGENESGNSNKEIEFQLSDNSLVLKRIGDLHFNVDGLKLPDIP